MGVTPLGFRVGATLYFYNLCCPVSFCNTDMEKLLGNRRHHGHQLYLAVEDIDHSKGRAKSLQSNGICERFHSTTLNEFYQIAFRKKLYRSLDEIQKHAV